MTISLPPIAKNGPLQAVQQRAAQYLQGSELPAFQKNRYRYTPVEELLANLSIPPPSFPPSL